MDKILELSQVCKTFGKTYFSLNNVSFSILKSILFAVK